MVTQELATMPGWKLAPFTTPLAEIVGADPPLVAAPATLRIRLWPVSAMNTFPALSTRTPYGVMTLALAGGPPSPFPRLPVANGVPFPANVLMIPDGFTIRIR